MRGDFYHILILAWFFIDGVLRRFYFIYYFTQIINWATIERRFLLTKKCFLHSLLYTFRAWVRFSGHIFWKKRFVLLAAPKPMSFLTISNEKIFFSKLKTLLKELIFCFYFVACSSNEFKNDIGNKPCKRCGANSNSLRTSCRCFADHHRELNLIWNSSSPCYSKFIL